MNARTILVPILASALITNAFSSCKPVDSQTQTHTSGNVGSNATQSCIMDVKPEKASKMQAWSRTLSISQTSSLKEVGELDKLPACEHSDVSRFEKILDDVASQVSGGTSPGSSTNGFALDSDGFAEPCGPVVLKVAKEVKRDGSYRHHT
jgi:hypothetical protein